MAIVERVKRRDIEAECLEAFRRVLDEMGLRPDGHGYGSANRFDAGFALIGQQRFQYGDLRVVKPDRIIVVEVESAGGMTNLVKYWPLAAAADVPILLLHAFGQGSANDYLSHLLLWEFVWEKMRAELWRRPAPMLFARPFRFTKTDPTGLAVAADAFRACLTNPLADVLRDVFGFNPG